MDNLEKLTTKVEEYKNTLASMESKMEENSTANEEKDAKITALENAIVEMKNSFDELKNSRHEENQLKEEFVSPKPKEKEVLSDKELLEHYLFLNLDRGSMRHYFNSIEGIKYVDFEFVPSIDEDDKKLDSLVKLKGKVLNSEERSTNEKVREVQDDDGISDFIGNFLGKFTKKKTFIKKIRVEEEKIMKLAKECYYNNDNRQENI